MAVRVKGSESGVSITRFARGTDISALGSAYQVTWRKRGALDFNSLSFESYKDALTFYDLVLSSYEIA